MRDTPAMTTCEEALEILERDPTAFKITKKVTNKTYNKGAQFFDVTVRGIPLWLSAEGITITRGVANPNDLADMRVKPDPNKPTEINRMQFQLETTVKNAGKYGELMVLLKTLFEAWGEEFKKANKLYATHSVTPIMQTMVKQGVNAGADIDDPIIRLKHDLNGKYLGNFPYSDMRGVAITTVYESKTTDGEITSEVIANDYARVDGTDALITNETLYQLMKTGAHIKAIDINMSTVSLAGGKFSWQIQATQLSVIKPKAASRPNGNAFKIIKAPIALQPVVVLPKVEDETLENDDLEDDVVDKIDIAGVMGAL